MSADAFTDWIYQWFSRGKTNLSYGAPDILRINTVLRIVFNQALFTSARCIWHSTNYATRGTISPPRKKPSSSLSFLLGTEIFPLTSLQIKSFLVFLMTAVQNGGTEPFDGVKNNLMEVCPALPHKKKEDECASSLPSRSQGKTLRTSFLEEKTAVKGQRRKVGNRIFFKDVSNNPN